MPHYAVSYDIHYDSTYSARYNSLVAEIGKTPGKSVWDETTSFALVETSESLSTFADRLYFRTQFSAATDKLLVIDYATSTAIGRGPFKYPNTLKAHFRSCTLK